MGWAGLSISHTVGSRPIMPVGSVHAFKMIEEPRQLDMRGAS